jgi:hypothetical protein
MRWVVLLLLVLLALGMCQFYPMLNQARDNMGASVARVSD